MYGYSGHQEEQDDTNDSSSCSSSYKHFDPTVRQGSRLGRRRLLPHKEQKSREINACSDKKYQLQKDDSGISTSETTPSITHSAARRGFLFSNHPKPDVNNPMLGFTPSTKVEQENHFALSISPKYPFKGEPLKEINGISRVIDKSINCSDSSQNTIEGSHKSVSLQKQLNSSFICDESLPLMNTNDLQQNSARTNETPNEISVSDDSSFMTAHDIQRPDVQPNKTIYDPEFFKTPGKNLAEIRIDESPFNPLEGFLEESDDFGDRKRTPSNNLENRGNLLKKTNGSAPKETPKTRNDVLNVVPPAIDHSQSDQIAYPLVETDPRLVPEYQVESDSKKSLPESSGGHEKNNIIQLKDNGFKHPGFALAPHKKYTNKLEMSLNASDVGNLRSDEEKGCEEMNHGSCSHDEVTNVTYPQHARGHHSQKNSFTSQFSLNPPHKIKSGLQDSGMALSLSSRPLSAASCVNNRGVISSSVVPSSNPFNNSSNNGTGAINSEVGSLMRHPPTNNRDHRRNPRRISETQQYPDNRAATPLTNESNVHCSNGVTKTQPQSTDPLDSSITWISCVKPVKSQTNPKVPDPEGLDNQEEDHSTSGLDTMVACENTIVEKGINRPPQPQSEPSNQNRPQVNSISVTSSPQSKSQQPKTAQTALDTQQSTQSVVSALIKPLPQNVIQINGTPYTVLSLLGKGGSSQVYQALGPQSSKLMAIKCVNLANVEEAMATDYLNEIALLSKLQGCPSVIKMIEHEYVEESQMLYVVLEKGDIDFSKLIKNINETKQMSMPMITYYWTEMLSAVYEIHKRGIIHSDLKPANFLLVEGRLKLIDFGIASSLQGEDTTSVLKEVPAGTYNYMSPEAISGQKINRKSDVWSMGCILYNLLYGRTPFSHLNNRWQKLHAIADRNQKVSFPKLQHHTPPSLRLALRWCLIKETASRPTVEELVKLSELTPHVDSSLGKEIDGMMCKYFRKVLPNLKVLSEEDEFV